MEVLSLIILNVIFPVFVLIGIGIFLHRKFTFNLDTLSKITTYYFLPTVGFANIYESEINGKVLVEIIVFQIILCVSLMIISSLIAKLLRLDKGMSANLKNSIVLVNSGNFGIPVSQLVFSHNPLGLSIQIVVMIIQNFVTYTYGLINSVSVNFKGLKVFYEFVKMPMIYALLLGLLLQGLNVKIPDFIWSPIKSVSDGFLAMALLTLGAQVAYIKIKKISLVLILSCFGRLILAPLISLFLIYICQLEGTTAQALFIASSYPSSRNSAQLALEYNNYPEFAGQTVLVSTLLSCVTVTVIVYVSKLIF
ncbi:AEC family transporter [Metabacillus bambusae]|uniref:AEC family transporter n=1 Tax=Metabacillus bambusae TaxID=2795218 RepID=A0ABS3N0A8_9BACI|nr:AEC family transporter [Metabacillus bambusae]MBO1511511.1 AEC family transporter [Metabacillus bambusae]